MADLAQLQTWLAEAEAARHNVAIGSGVTEVWRDGRHVTYTKASLDDLNDYIADLLNQIAMLENEAACKPRRSAISTVWE